MRFQIFEYLYHFHFCSRRYLKNPSFLTTSRGVEKQRLLTYSTRLLMKDWLLSFTWLYKVKEERMKFTSSLYTRKN